MYLLSQSNFNSPVDNLVLMEVISYHAYDLVYEGVLINLIMKKEF